MHVALNPLDGRMANTPPCRTDRVSMFGIQIDAIDLPSTVDRLLEIIRQSPACCQYVVTPNVDHVVRLQHDGALRAAYRRAALVVADGWPVVWASRRLGRALPGLVPGSDLVPALFAAASRTFRESGGPPLRVFLLGAAPGVARQAAGRIESRWPGVQVVGQVSPPLGFEHHTDENDRILRQIADVRPDVLVVGLGAPKQELWVDRHQADIRSSVALCVGATIDFLAGHRRRAPRWLRRCRLEWLHRLLSEPRRLAARYARGAVVFPCLVWREWRRRATSHG